MNNDKKRYRVEVRLPELTAAEEALSLDQQRRILSCPDVYVACNHGHSAAMKHAEPSLIHRKVTLDILSDLVPIVHGTWIGNEKNIADIGLIRARTGGTLARAAVHFAAVGPMKQGGGNRTSLKELGLYVHLHAYQWISDDRELWLSSNNVLLIYNDVPAGYLRLSRTHPLTELSTAASAVSVPRDPFVGEAAGMHEPPCLDQRPPTGPERMTKAPPPSKKPPPTLKKNSADAYKASADLHKGSTGVQ